MAARERISGLDDRMQKGIGPLEPQHVLKHLHRDDTSGDSADEAERVRPCASSPENEKSRNDDDHDRRNTTEFGQFRKKNKSERSAMLCEPK